MSGPATFSIGDRRIGAGHPCFVIAEAGVNHDGDPALAHRLVDVAAEAGADAVKFQTFDPDLLVSESAAAAPYQRQRGAQTQRPMLEALTLPKTVWAELAAHADERGVAFLSTAFDPSSLEILLDVRVAALKVPSGELDNLTFIRDLARRGLPLVISTGLATMDEVDSAVEAASAAPGLALLHCVTAYPSPVESSNLRAMAAMARRHRVPVGWSDHTEGSVTAVVAVALGASILEKHFTTDRRRSGPDHAASAEPADLAAYVAAARAAERSLGDGRKRPVPEEIDNRRFARRSFHASRDLAPGHVVGDGDVVLLRPATGLPPSAEVVGRVVARAVSAGHPLTPEDLR